MANKPTPIDPERITTEAQKAAWLYDTIVQACPYPWGTPAAHIFTAAFDAAKQAMADNYAPQPKVAAPNVNKMAGHYTPSRDAYYRNDGSAHVPSRGVGC